MSASRRVELIERLESRLLFAAGDLIGKMTSDVLGGAGKILLQSDGKIINELQRFMPDGTLDPTFSTAGDDFTIDGRDTFVGPELLQRDGKILLTGYGHKIDNQFLDEGVVMRLNDDGSIDSSFHGAFVPVTNKNYIGAAAEQGDGKIVLAGQADDAKGTWDFYVQRLMSDGQVDTGFGTGGVTVTGFANADQDIATCVGILSDRRIVVAGYSDDFPQRLWSVAEFSADGTLLKKLQFDPGNINYGMPWEIAVQPDDKIVLAGSEDYVAVVARLNPDLTLDQSFGIGGMNITEIPGGPDTGLYTQGKSLSLQSDGGIVVGGYFGDQGADQYGLCVLRFKSDGSLLTATSTMFPRQDTLESDSIVTGDGRILVLGTDYPPEGDEGDTMLAAAIYSGGRYAYRGKPAPAAIVQAEEFDNGGEGVSVHDTTALNTGGGPRSSVMDNGKIGDVGYLTDLHTGEWAEYTVSVPMFGAFDLKMTAGNLTGVGGTVRVLIDGVPRGGAITIPDAPGGDSALPIFTAAQSILLSPGNHRVRLQMLSEGAGGIVGDIDSFGFTSPAIVTGTFWEDTNRNGVKDLGDRGLAKWRIYADLNSNETFDPGEPSLLTDANGYFAASVPTTPGYIFVGWIPAQDGYDVGPVNGDYLYIFPGQTIILNRGYEKLAAPSPAILPELKILDPLKSDHDLLQSLLE